MVKKLVFTLSVTSILGSTQSTYASIGASLDTLEEKRGGIVRSFKSPKGGSLLIRKSSHSQFQEGFFKGRKERTVRRKATSFKRVSRFERRKRGLSLFKRGGLYERRMARRNATLFKRVLRQRLWRHDDRRLSFLFRKATPIHPIVSLVPNQRRYIRTAPVHLRNPNIVPAVNQRPAPLLVRHAGIIEAVLHRNVAPAAVPVVVPAVDRVIVPEIVPVDQGINPDDNQNSKGNTAKIKGGNDETKDLITSTSTDHVSGIAINAKELDANLCDWRDKLATLAVSTVNEKHRIDQKFLDFFEEKLKEDEAHFSALDSNLDKKSVATLQKELENSRKSVNILKSIVKKAKDDVSQSQPGEKLNKGKAIITPQQKEESPSDKNSDKSTSEGSSSLEVKPTTLKDVLAPLQEELAKLSGSNLRLETLPSDTQGYLRFLKEDLAAIFPNLSVSLSQKSEEQKGLLKDLTALSESVNAASGTSLSSSTLKPEALTEKIGFVRMWAFGLVNFIKGLLPSSKK